MMSGLTWNDETITKIDPDNNTLETKRGNTYTYDYLVVCPGIKLRYDKIEGA